MLKVGLRCALPVVAALLAAGGCAEPPAVSDPEQIRELYRAGRHVEAERAARGYLRSQRRAHGEPSPEVAAAYDWLVRTCRAAGDEQDPRCLERAERALAAWEAAVGPDDPRLVPALRQIATIHLKATFRREAVRPLIERVLAIREARFPPPSAEVAEALGFLGANLLHQEGDLRAARREHGRALEMIAALPAVDPILRAKVRLDLARVEASSARFDAALQHTEEALAILASATPSPSLLAAAHDLRGEILQRRGDLERAEEAFAAGEAIRLAEAGDTGDRGAAIALSWKARAGLAAELGDDFAARALLERALERLATGQDPQLRPAGYLDRMGEVVDAEARLSTLLLDAGELDAAEARLARAFGVVASAGIRNPLLLARLHEQRAELYRRSRRASAARADLDRALAFYESRLTPDHPLVARVLLERGRLELEGEAPRSATAPIHAAVAIYRAALGPDHPQLAEALLLLAEERRAAGALDEAFAAVEEAATIMVAHRLAVVRFLPEGVALRLREERLVAIDRWVRSAAERGRPDEIRRAWKAFAAVRGAALDAAAERRRAADDEGRAELAAARRRLAYLHLAPFGDQPFAGRAALLGEAREELERVERRLGAAGSGGVASDLDPLRLAPPGAALVAYCELREGAEASVVAFALSASGELELVTVGAARELGDLVAGWRAAVRRAAAGGAAGEEGRRAARAAGEALRRFAWDPVRRAVGGAARAVIVPDAALHFVPFEALPDDDGRFLLESSPVFSYAGAERDLVRPDAGAIPSWARGDLLLVGAPSPLPKVAPFAELPGAEAELAEIAGLWRGRGRATDLRSGAVATEGELARRVSRASVVHLATHAFFAELASGGLEIRGEPGSAGPPPGRSALSGSGIVLAADDRAPDPALADGLLSGEEISALDLDRVELVVLSACDSGAGTPARAEGVLGLRRGFALAGARRQLLALFPVEDEAARAWMRSFYERLIAGEPAGVAARAASLDRLAERRAAGRADDVRAWGAFILLGVDAARSPGPATSRVASR